MSMGEPVRIEDDLDTFYDAVLDLILEGPEPGPDLIHSGHKHVHVALEAPFGSDGPMLFQFGDTLAMLFDWSTTQSGMKISDPDHLLFDYTRMMMAFPLFLSSPRRIEMIGLGGGSVAKACYQLWPECDITVVEIDPRVIALRDRFHVPLDDHRFRVVEGDGADFVTTASGRPDVLLVDGFTAKGLPCHLSSQAFYDMCRLRLGSNGLFVANLCDQFTSFAPPLRRISQSFDGRMLSIPAEKRGNRVVFACAAANFPPALETLKTAHAHCPGSLVHYQTKARRIARILKRWSPPPGETSAPAIGSRLSP